MKKRLQSPNTSKSLHGKPEIVSHRRWKIHISIRSRALKISSPTLQAIMRRILYCVDVEISPQRINEIHVLLVNDAYMREINFEFRRKDKATDVLSFPQYLPREIRGSKKITDAAGSYLGDLVISTETTIRQARQFGTSTRAELIRLLTHGVLHLCGYDHEGVSAKEAQRMRRRERAIRAAIQKKIRSH